VASAEPYGVTPEKTVFLLIIELVKKTGSHAITIYPSIYIYIYLSIYIYIYLSMTLQHFVGLWPLFSFFIIYTVGRTPRTGDQPVARPLLAHTEKPKQNKSTQTSMPPVGFKPTIPVFELAKTVHALDGAATLIGAMQTQDTLITIQALFNACKTALAA
jgi:hypothetical protein